MSTKLKRQGWKKGIKHIHVNQGLIKQCNALRKKVLDGLISQEEAEAGMPDCITMKYDGKNVYGTSFIVYHPKTGEEVGRFEHTPFNPYVCGAQIIFTTTMNVIPVPRVLSDDEEALREQVKEFGEMHHDLSNPHSSTNRDTIFNLEREMKRIWIKLLDFLKKETEKESEN